MFIKYGSKGTPVKEPIPSENSTCPNCNTANSLQYHLTCNYFHLYWIPLFTYGKEGTLKCDQCQEVVSPFKMPKATRDEFIKVKRKVWPPIWHFSGILVFGLLFYFVSVSVAEQNKNNPIYLANPLVGDVYKYEVSAREYSTMKIAEISTDTIYFLHNEFTIKRRSKLHKIDKEKNYTNGLTIGIAKSELNDMFEKGDLFEINR